MSDGRGFGKVSHIYMWMDFIYYVIIWMFQMCLAESRNRFQTVLLFFPPPSQFSRFVQNLFLMVQIKNVSNRHFSFYYRVPWNHPIKTQFVLKKAISGVIHKWWIERGDQKLSLVDHPLWFKLKYTSVTDRTYFAFIKI